MNMFSALGIWFRNFVALLDKNTKKEIIYMVGISIALFVVELLFAYAIQSFLFASNVLIESNNLITRTFGNDIFRCTILLILVAVIRFIFIYLKTYFSSTLAQSFILAFRKKMLTNFSQVPQSYSSYQILSYFLDYTSQGSTYISVSASFICNLIFLSLTLSGVLIIAPREAAVCISISGIFFLIVKGTNKLSDISTNLNQQIEVINKTIILGLKNYQLLKIYGAFERELRVGLGALDRYFYHYKRFAKTTSLASATPWLIGIIAAALTTAISQKTFHGTSANLVTFFYLLVRLAQNFGETNQAYATLRTYYIPYKLLLKLNSTITPVPLGQSGKETHLRTIDTIKFENVSYALPDGSQLIENLNLNLTKGDVLVIKGKSGTGKSTILSLLCGLNTPNLGSIYFDGKKMNGYFTDQLTEIIGFVDAEPFMIEGSVKDNLLFANPRGDVNIEELNSILAQVGLDEKIQSLTEGVNSLLSEKTELSTGQKQRISLARALLRKPHLLILDEATANLDIETEKTIIETVARIRLNMITLVVSHKDSFDSIATKNLYTHRVD